MRRLVHVSALFPVAGNKPKVYLNSSTTSNWREEGYEVSKAPHRLKCSKRFLLFFFFNFLTLYWAERYCYMVFSRRIMSYWYVRRSYLAPFVFFSCCSVTLLLSLAFARTRTTQSFSPFFTHVVLFHFQGCAKRDA